MGQNLALNIAKKGFPISVYNHTSSKVDETNNVAGIFFDRAKIKGNLPLTATTPLVISFSQSNVAGIFFVVAASISEISRRTHQQRTPSHNIQI